MALGLFNFLKAKAGSDAPVAPAVAHYRRGNQLKDQGALEDALASYDAALALDPGYAHALLNRGFVLERLARWAEALDSYERVIALTPADALAHYNRAAVLRQLERPDEALASYASAIAARPDYLGAYYNRGLLLMVLQRPDEALESFDTCLRLDPGFAPAHLGRGTLLTGQRRWQAARDAIERALALQPEYAEAHAALGVWLAGIGERDAALTCHERATALNPGCADAWLNRGNVLVDLKRFAEAVDSYDRGLALTPEAHFVHGMRRYAQMHICDWSNYQADVDALAAGIGEGRLLSPPLPFVAMADSPALHRRASEAWVKDQHTPRERLTPLQPHPAGARVRIGYFSSDLHEHPVGLLITQLLELHDRSRFETYAFSFGPDTQDATRRRLARAVDHFVDVRARTDLEVAQLARELQIDIAIDLNGHTAGSRTGIFALRAAPIQVNWLGYPGTLGADCMDYLVADDVVVPAAQERHYAEKVVRLPHGFMPHDAGRPIAGRFTRAALDLPDDGFVFCCFNNSFKITPDVFDDWMRILGRVSGSVLWLSRHNETAMANLRREAVRRGVDGARLVFATRLPSAAEHLARHAAADLFLDTRPYNAHATTLDALWAGLPVLTLPGESFASRVAASLLTAIGLPELIAGSTADYADLAVALAADRPRLALLRARLAHNRVAGPLFDTARFTRDLEAAYALMVDRLRAGLPPDHLRLPG